MSSSFRSEAWDCSHNAKILAIEQIAAILGIMEISRAQTLPQKTVQPAVRSVSTRVVQGDISGLEPGERATARVVQNSGSQTVVDLNGNRVVLDRLPGVREGQQLAVSLLQSRGQTTLQVIQIETPQTAQLSSLSVGQRVSGELVASLGDGRFLLEVQGTLLEAAGPRNLIGQTTLALQVEQLAPQLVFRVLGESQLLQQVAIESLTSNLEVRQPVGESLGGVRAVLAEFVANVGIDELPRSLARLQSVLQNFLPNAGELNSTTVRNLLDNNGVNFESRLVQLANGDPQALNELLQNNLKSVLLQVFQELGTSSSVDAQSLINSIQAQLTQIESQQLLNFLALLHGGPLRLQIPFLDEDPTTVFLSINPDERGNGDEDGRPAPYNILLMLELEEIGQTRIDALVQENSIRVLFYVEDEQSRNLLTERIGELDGSLREIGFANVLSAVNSLEFLDAEKRQKFDNLAKGLPESVHLIDIMG